MDGGRPDRSSPSKKLDFKKEWTMFAYEATDASSDGLETFSTPNIHHTCDMSKFGVFLGLLLYLRH